MKQILSIRGMSKSDVQKSGKLWILEKTCCPRVFYWQTSKDVLNNLASASNALPPLKGQCIFYSKATPHNCVCKSQPSFCPTSAVPKMGNTYSIPPSSELWIEAKILSETSCRIVRCCHNISVDDTALNCRLKSLSTVDVWLANHFCSIDTISWLKS